MRTVEFKPCVMSANVFGFKQTELDSLRLVKIINCEFVNHYFSRFNFVMFFLNSAIFIINYYKIFFEERY